MEKKKVLVRCAEAGVFYGIITRQENTPAGVIVEMTECRRLWYWNGAASLSQMALEGVKRPSECKFTAPLSHITLIGVIEIIPVTQEAEANLNSVEVWRV